MAEQPESGSQRAGAERAAGAGRFAAGVLSRRRALLALADAFFAAAVLLLGEAVLVALVHRRQLVGVYEFARAFSGLYPVALAAAGPVAVGGAVLLWALPQQQRWPSRFVLVSLGGLLAMAVAVGISGGRSFEGALRPLFVVISGLVGGALLLLGVGSFRLLHRGAKSRGWVLAATLLAVLTLECANQWVWPRLYPALHGGLAVLTVWLAALGAASLPGWRPSDLTVAVDGAPSARRGVFAGSSRLVRARIAAAPVLWLLGIGLCPWAAERFSLQDNVRLLYLERAPLLSHGVLLAAWLAPPPQLEAEPGRSPGTSQAASLDLSGYDVLLVTIDALRADHVGGYGYPRPTSPEIDRLAQEGAIFEAAYTPTPHTCYAITSLLTGKYMRPLLLQGVGQDSETWPMAMRRYGYRTAGFYPPAVVYIDRRRFERFEPQGLGFEYRKVEFASPAVRVRQVAEYLVQQSEQQRLFLWVHLFEPHEPYVEHPEHAFGPRDLDRYDSEVAAADAGLGQIVRLVRSHRPRTLVIVAADHGEEFGEHGGRYHGTTVYDEQVRVPLVFHAPGRVAPRRVSEPVSLVDLMPTVLSGLGMPSSPRIGGRDLGALLTGSTDGPGFAFSETDEQTLLAQSSLRLVCARRVGACRLFDIAVDPLQQRDICVDRVAECARLKRRSQSFVASIGRFETRAVSDEGAAQRPWPAALRRGIAGEGEAAVDVALLLDDADLGLRRKAAEVLFELARPAAAARLRRALQGDEDETVRRWCALALTRMGQGAPLSFDLLRSESARWRRLAALALAEAGDDRGEDVLIDWWRASYPDPDSDEKQAGRERLSLRRARQIAAGLATVRSSAAVVPLTHGLVDVRLRPHLARALAEIGDDGAAPALGRAFREERYADARAAIASALVTLGASAELRRALARFLGVPDPLPRGLELATRAGIIPYVGGPTPRALDRLRRFASSGAAVGITVPEGGNGGGVRVLVRARSTDGTAGQVRFGLLAGPPPGPKDRAEPVPARAPRLEPALAVRLRIPDDGRFHEVFETLPIMVGQQVEPGQHAFFVVYATQNVQFDTCAVVPLADEIPPPVSGLWPTGD